MSHLTKFLSRKGFRGSTSTTSTRSLASVSNPDEPPKIQGVYLENEDPLHQAKTFPLQQQIGTKKEVETSAMHFTAKSISYNKILSGVFRSPVTEDTVSSLADSIMPDVNVEDLTPEEKKAAAEKGIRDAFDMFTFFPDDK